MTIWCSGKPKFDINNLKTENCYESQFKLVQHSPTRKKSNKLIAQSFSHRLRCSTRKRNAFDSFANDSRAGMEMETTSFSDIMLNNSETNENCRIIYCLRHRITNLRSSSYSFSVLLAHKNSLLHTSRTSMLRNVECNLCLASIKLFEDRETQQLDQRIFSSLSNRHSESNRVH